MTIQWKDGKILWSDGKIAMHPDCCDECNPPNTACCSGFPDVNLKLTITEFTVNAGGSCPGGCATDAIEIIDWPATSTDSRDGASWSFSCPEFNPNLRGNFAIYCTGVTYQVVNSFFSMLQLVDRCAPTPITGYCFVGLTSFYLGRTDIDGEVTCSPFFIDKVVPINLRNPGVFDVCATGSMRVTITE